MQKIKPDVRERVLEHGISYAFDEELVMLILGSGNKSMSVEDMAVKIIEKLNDSNADNVIEALKNLRGIGNGKALQIAAAIELGKRIVLEPDKLVNSVSTSGSSNVAVIFFMAIVSLLYLFPLPLEPSL